MTWSSFRESSAAVHAARLSVSPSIRLRGSSRCAAQHSATFLIILDAVRFDSTDWSQLHRARQRDQEAGESAFGFVLSRYRPAMISYVSTQFRLESSEAEEIVQQFILDRWIEKNLLEQADQTRGKFRSFLAVALGNYVRDVFRKQGRAPAALANDVVLEGIPAVTENDPFDQAWAETLIAQALVATERELRAKGRESFWELFEARVVGEAFAEADGADLPTLAHRLGFSSPRDASNAIVTAKRTFERVLLSLVEDEEFEDARAIADELLKIVQRRAT